MHDLSELTDQERMLLIHAAYGEVMLRAHGLERKLVALLICHSTFTPNTGTSLGARIAKLNRLPLGPLIEEFILAFDPSDILIEELDNLLYLRNELAHRISDTIIRAATQMNWEEEVVKELDEIRSFFVDTGHLLNTYVKTCRAKVGLTEELMVEVIKKVYPGAAGRVKRFARSGTPRQVDSSQLDR